MDAVHLYGILLIRIPFIERWNGSVDSFRSSQLTMFIVALRNREQFTRLSWVGLILAFSGLVYLVSPGLTAPDPIAALLMAVAGIAWGFYSVLGQGAADPL